MRTLIALLLAVLAVAATAAPAGAATRSCPQSDPDNGITSVRAGNMRCVRAFAVAQRTNSVKCFLNGDRCEHRFKGRTWTCRLKETATGATVTCTSGRKVARYTLG